MDEDIGEIEMLTDFDEALLGCVYSEDGTPCSLLLKRGRNETTRAGRL
jgi:hypothetical protein